MQGARTTRTLGLERVRRARRAALARPASAQVRLSQTRTVSGGGAGSPSIDDVEMGVEGGDLVDLGQGQPHLVGERREMARVQAAVAVLDQVQVLDQQVARARPVAEQRPDLLERRRVDLPALRRRRASCGGPSRDGCCGPARVGFGAGSWMFIRS